MKATTYHTYPDLLFTGGRLAATEWGDHPAACSSLAQAVAATLSLDAEAVVLEAVCGAVRARGHAPGGLGA